MTRDSGPCDTGDFRAEIAPVQTSLSGPVCAYKTRAERSACSCVAARSERRKGGGLRLGAGRLSVPQGLNQSERWRGLGLATFCHRRP
jgi:hypothetical protein